MAEQITDQEARSHAWRVRLAIAALTFMAMIVVSVTNRMLTDRFTETTRNRAELRLSLYSGNLLAELRQNAIVPQLLARDPALIAALNSEDYQLSTQRLISFVEEIGAASLMLLDKEGRTVAATDRNRLGELVRFEDGTRVVGPDVPATIALLELAYDKGVEAFDQAFGLLVDALAARPAWPDTAVLIPSDHGEALFTRGWGEHGHSLF